MGILSETSQFWRRKFYAKCKENGSKEPLLRENMRKIEIKTFRIWNCQISQKCVKEGN